MRMMPTGRSHHDFEGTSEIQPTQERQRRSLQSRTTGQQAERPEHAAHAAESDQRLARIGPLKTVLIGSTQILALLAGISRDAWSWWGAERHPRSLNVKPQSSA